VQVSWRGGQEICGVTGGGGLGKWWAVLSYWIACHPRIQAAQSGPERMSGLGGLQPLPAEIFVCVHEHHVLSTVRATATTVISYPRASVGISTRILPLGYNTCSPQ
jgi:hypothetical protein